MFVRVSGKSFRSVVDRLIVNATETINLYKQGNLLYIHTYGAVVHYKYIDILESDTDDFEMSVVVGKMLTLLNDKEDVVLSRQQDIFTITQANFVCRVEINFEGRLDLNAFEQTFDTKYSISSLKELNNDCKSLDNLARALGMRYAPINIYKGKAYLVYSNTALAEKIDLPDMLITSETLRKLVPVLTGSKYDVCYVDYEHGYVYFKVATDEVAVMQMNPVDVRTAMTVEEQLVELSKVTDVDMAMYSEGLSLICQVYPKTLLDMTVGDGGLAFYKMSDSIQFELWNVPRSLCTIRVSTPQVLAVQRLFGHVGSASIMRGDNKLCLVQRTLGKELLIAGLLF